MAGSSSRSAVNYNAGVRTAMSNIVMSIVVLITLLVLTPIFKYTPSTILSAIIISAVLSLIDVREKSNGAPIPVSYCGPDPYALKP